MEIKLFVATKAFIEKDGKVLVVKEAPAYQSGTHIGKFDLVGGRIQIGEKLEEALRREAREEIGADLEIGAPFFADESLPHPVVKDDEWQVIKIFFRCKLQGEIKLGNDHDEFKWIDPREYAQAGLIENLYPAFDAYNQGP